MAVSPLADLASSPVGALLLPVGGFKAGRAGRRPQITRAPTRKSLSPLGDFEQHVPAPPPSLALSAEIGAQLIFSHSLDPTPIVSGTRDSSHLRERPRQTERPTD